MKATQDLISLVEDLRAEASQVYSTLNREFDYVSHGKLQGLAAGCKLLIIKLGPFGHVWSDMLRPPEDNHKSSLDQIASVLDTIATSLSKNRLSTLEEMVSAEVLGDLLEHAEELLKSKFNLAAAVILRALLEERLRKLCTSNNCFPAAQKPTIENFKQALYSAQVIDKIVMKDIDWMAGVGNTAAHNLPEYRDEDVPALHARLGAFLSRFSVT